MRPTAVRLERALRLRLESGDGRLGSPGLVARVVELARGRGRRVLDLGSGCGGLVARLGAEGIPAVGLDLCQAALERARRDAGAGIPLVQADVERLPIASRQVDLVTCLLVAHYLARPGRAFSEAARVLRPDGWLVVADRISSPDPALRERHQRLESLRNPSVRRLLTSRELGEEVARAGFRVRLVDFVEETVGLDEWLAGVDPRAASRIRKELTSAPVVELGGIRVEAPGLVRLRIDLVLAQRVVPPSVIRNLDAPHR